MENGWTKCGVKLPTSSSMVTSSSQQIQLHEPRNQMNMNASHYIPQHDVRELGSVSPQMKQAPSSNILNFSSCKPTHPESGSSFLSLLSAPPSILQYDAQRQLDMPSFGDGCISDTSALGNVGTMPSWPLSQDRLNFNVRPGADVRPTFQSGPIMNANSGSCSGLSDDINTLKAFISQSGKRNESGINTSLQNGVKCAPSSSSTLLDASLQTLSSITRKQTSVASDCPRVFCMGASGDLLLSSTGLFGILCSCHNNHMSVAKFCEHSGISDVNPGYAVRLESGESIAQWRKVYLQKFGIRAPGDHRGWDWPEGLLAASGLTNSSMAVGDRRKVYDLSSLFNSSAESSTQLCNNVSTSRSRSTKEFSTQVTKSTQCENNGFDHTGSFGRNLHSSAENPDIACPTVKSCRPPLPSGNDELGNSSQLRSFHFMPSQENSLNSVSQNSQSVGSNVSNNLKDDVLHRGTLPSSIELKLGQPCQLSWGSGSAALSAGRPHTYGVQATTVDETLNCNMENAKVTGKSNQRLICHPASDFSRTKDSFQSGRLSDAQTSFHAGPLTTPLMPTNGATHVQNVKDRLHDSFANSVLVSPSNTSAGGCLYHEKISKRTTDSHSFSPWTLHHQPHVDKSVLIDFSRNGDAPIRSLNISDSLNRKSRTIDATGGHRYSSVGNQSSSRSYAKQMESSGSNKTGRTCNSNSSALPLATSSPLVMTNMFSDVSGSSSYIGNAFNMASNLDRDQCSSKLTHASYSFRTTPTLQATSTGFTSLSAVLTPGHGSASLGRDRDAINSFASDESIRLLASRNADKLHNEKNNASLEFNQRTRIQSEHRQQSNNCTISDLKAQSLFLDKGPFEGQWHRHPFSDLQTASLSFSHGSGHKKGMNLGAVSEEMTLRSGLTDNYNEECGNLQPKQLPSLSCGRRENMEYDCNMVQGYYRESSSHISDRCNCNVQTVCSKREQDCNGSCSINRLKKQPGIAAVEIPMYNSSRFSNNASIGKATLVECSHKGKVHHLKSEFRFSQWIDVPSKAQTVSELRCPNAPVHVTDTTEEPERNLKDLATEGTPKAADFLKGKELSDISSECSALAVTQASNEVNMTDSVTVDASLTIYDGSHIADQGSAISRSCSSVEAISSVRNSQLNPEGKTRSEEESLTTLEDATRHSVTNVSKETHPKSNDTHDFVVSGGSSGEPFAKTHNESESKSRKRKRTIKRKTQATPFTFSEISLLPSESRVYAGSAANRHAPSQDVQGLCQSNLISTEMLNVNSSYNSFKRRRSSFFSVKKPSHNRDKGIDDIVEGDLGDQVSLKGIDNSIGMTESTAIRKSKQVKPAEAFKKKVKFTETIDGCYNPISDGTLKCSSNVSQKLKPVACGKYGIICVQELDIDQLKPPKIVPLSQVLKASQRHGKFEKEVTVPPKRKKKTISCGGKRRLDVLSGSTQSQAKRLNKVLLCHSRVIDAPTQETQHMLLKNTHVDDPSVSEEDRADEDERNIGASTSCQTALSKGKETRMRCVYELSLRGTNFISADNSHSQQVVCAPPTVCALEMITSKNAGKSEGDESRAIGKRSCRKLHCSSLMSETDKLCCVCGISNKDNANCLLECGQCSIQIHQACYGITRVPKGDWYCRPCRTSSKDVACVLCGYGGGAMTRAFGSRNVVKSLLKAWDIRTEPNIISVGSAEALYVPAKMECQNSMESETFELCPTIKPVVHNSIVFGLFDPTVKQWVHMVCGLWTPGTRCPNVDTMSAFDVSSVSHLNDHMVCYICNRAGGSCIRCRVETCYTHFHPWCAHHKGLLQSEVEGPDSHEIGFYGRCLLHANPGAASSENDRDTDQPNSETERDKEPTCARTEGYQGKKQRDYSSYQHSGKGGCLVTQVQLDAWLYINRHKLRWNKQPKSPVSDVDHDYRKEYTRYKQAKGWRQLVVYKSGIHALGLYTSQFIQRSAMVVEYVGEIVGHRVADKRETEYLTGRKLQYKSACYFFRIDKEQIIDATCKGGIARFVNHSCQPNCVAKVLTIRGDKKVVFFAQRDIYPGEEITYDYHFNHEDEGKKIPCFCNSKNCRRYLN